MGRSVSKGPFIDTHLETKMAVLAAANEKKVVRTWSSAFGWRALSRLPKCRDLSAKQRRNSRRSWKHGRTSLKPKTRNPKPEACPNDRLRDGRIRESLAERRFPNRLRARGWLGGHLATVEHGKPVWKPALRRSTKDSRMRPCKRSFG